MSDKTIATARYVPWYVLGVMFLIYACNMADRQILSILAVHIKADLALTDTQLGLLIGPAVALFYAFLGLPLAHAADRIHRVRFLASFLAAWSVLTSLGGLAANALQLAVTRLGVSIAEAGGTPVSAALIADHFRPQRRGLAMGIFGAAGSAGTFLSFALGGYASDHLGWRGALALAGIPGVVLAVILLTTVREPVRGAMDDNAAPPAVGGVSMWEAIRAIFHNKLFRDVLLATCFVNFAIAGTVGWGPTWIMRHYSASASQAGSHLGLWIVISGGCCVLLSGFLTDRTLRKGLATTLRIMALVQLTGVFVLAASLEAQSMHASTLGIGLLYGLMHFYVPVYWYVAHTAVDFRIRSMVGAVGILGATLSGGVIAPPTIGFLSDHLQPWLGASSLTVAMALIGVAILLSVIKFLAIARDLARGELSAHTPAFAG